MDTKALRQKILDLAIRGKLVPQDPNDEPAEVLLERIREQKQQMLKEGKLKKKDIKNDTIIFKGEDNLHYEKFQDGTVKCIEDEIPFEVPEGWSWTRLGSFFLAVTGSTPSTKDASLYGTEYPFYKPTDLNAGYNVYCAEDSVSKKGYLSGRPLPKFSVLVTCIGATIGKTGYISNAGICNQQINAILPNSEILPAYTYFCMCSQYEQQQICINSSATTLPILNKSKFDNLKFPIPPKEQKSQIVDRIKSLLLFVENIQNNQETLKKTVAEAKSKILDLAIHGKLVPQNPNDEPASELLKRINPKAEITCDNGHYPQLPDSWAVVPMQMLCSLTDGEKLDGKGMPNLDVKYLRGERDFKTLTNGRYVAANSLLILVDGENSGEVFRTPIEGYQGSTFKQLHINENMLAEYILHVINLHRKALRENKVGSAIPHLDKKLFKAIEVPVPPYDEQVRIVTVINSMHSKLDAIMENL